MGIFENFLFYEVWILNWYSQVASVYFCFLEDFKG